MPEERRAPLLHVLLDENVDRLLKSHFDPAFHVVTVPEQGLAGLSDGDLLRRAEEQFDVLVTMDQNLPYQQNLATFEGVVVVLKASSNAFPDVIELMSEVNEEIRDVKAGEATVVAA